MKYTKFFILLAAIFMLLLAPMSMAPQPVAAQGPTYTCFPTCSTTDARM
ncbi:MAG: hypothetical protein GXP41_09660, partial [Chloroflexi bacterium]|nr:hypothetical protein [Chloroflexota bacterium]